MQEVVEKGKCTKNCQPDDCCPEGYGCVELTPAFGQCKQGVSDSPTFVCTGEVPGGETPDGGPPVGGGDSGGGGAASGGDGGGGGGCGQAPAHRGFGALAVFSLAVLSLGRRRRR
jgi:hypothetical protein